MSWSWALAGTGLAGLYLLGRGSYRLGWLITLADQGAWLAYALATRQYGFLLSTAGYAYVAGLNVRATRRGRLPTRNLWRGTSTVTGRMKRDANR